MSAKQPHPDQIGAYAQSKGCRAPCQLGANSVISPARANPVPSDAVWLERAMLDPDIRRLLETVFNAPAASGPPDLAQLRAAAEAAPKLLGGPAEDVTSIRDLLAPARVGQVPVRIYRPASPGPLPLTLYAHGGGWVTGSLDAHDKLCRMLAKRLRSIVVAVGYRLAPEHVYPAALDDVDAAWRWARRNARTLGADGTRFAVGGDSSGANLVAALTLRIKQERTSQPDV